MKIEVQGQEEFTLGNGTNRSVKSTVDEPTEEAGENNEKNDATESNNEMSVEDGIKAIEDASEDASVDDEENTVEGIAKKMGWQPEGKLNAPDYIKELAVQQKQTKKTRDRLASKLDRMEKTLRDQQLASQQVIREQIDAFNRQLTEKDRQLESLRNRYIEEGDVNKVRQVERQQMDLRKQYKQAPPAPQNDDTGWTDDEKEKMMEWQEQNADWYDGTEKIAANKLFKKIVMENPEYGIDDLLAILDAEKENDPIIKRKLKTLQSKNDDTDNDNETDSGKKSKSKSKPKSPAIPSKRRGSSGSKNTISYDDLNDVGKQIIEAGMNATGITDKQEYINKMYEHNDSIPKSFLK
jgi:hypothetical protein